LLHKFGSAPNNSDISLRIIGINCKVAPPPQKTFTGKSRNLGMLEFAKAICGKKVLSGY
jgi:hypothetical protein